MTRTAGEIASYLGAELEGDPRVTVSGVSAPERAGPEDLIYIDSLRYLHRALDSRARCLLSGPELHVAGKTILRVANPKLAFAKVAAWLLPDRRVVEGIHTTAVIAASARVGTGVGVGPHAVIEDDVEVGAGSEIGPFCFLGRGSRVGENCRLYPRVTLYPGVVVGRRVVLHAGVILGSDGFGYVFGEGKQWKFPQLGELEIGDDVEIGANSTVDRGSLATTRIGAGVKIDNLVQVGHNVEVGDHTVIAAQTGIAGSSSIGRNVVIAGQVGIAAHCKIQDGAVLGAQAGIPDGKIIRARETVWGTPARPLRKFKEQFVLLSRLAQLVERVRKLEQGEPKSQR